MYLRDACEECGAKGVKLWRQYQTFTPKLFCARCACEREGVPLDAIRRDGTHESDLGSSDSIGWLVPAVPLPDRSGWWGYTSIPEAAALAWRELPLLPGATLNPVGLS